MDGNADVLRRLLEVAPLAWALPRAQEAILLGTEELPPPVLDLGCGNGLFARVSPRLHGVVGLDLDRGEACRARTQGVYRHVLAADACGLPFRGDSFGSVVSISTLEHISRLEVVLTEVRRVLAPSGVFVFSVPGPEFSQALAGARMLRAARCTAMAERYQRAIDRTFRHHNLLRAERWIELLWGYGFTAVTVKPFNPPPLTILQDLTYPLAVLPWIWLRITGRWVAWPAWRRGVGRILAALLAPRLSVPDSAGTCFLFTARTPDRPNGRPGRKAQTLRPAAGDPSWKRIPLERV